MWDVVRPEEPPPAPPPRRSTAPSPRPPAAPRAAALQRRAARWAARCGRARRPRRRSAHAACARQTQPRCRAAPRWWTPERRAGGVSQAAQGGAAACARLVEQRLEDVAPVTCRPLRLLARPARRHRLCKVAQLGAGASQAVQALEVAGGEQQSSLRVGTRSLPRLQHQLRSRPVAVQGRRVRRAHRARPACARVRGVTRATPAVRCQGFRVNSVTHAPGGLSACVYSSTAPCASPARSRALPLSRSDCGGMAGGGTTSLGGRVSLGGAGPSAHSAGCASLRVCRRASSCSSALRRALPGCEGCDKTACNSRPETHLEAIRRQHFRGHRRHVAAGTQ